MRQASRTIVAALAAVMCLMAFSAPALATASYSASGTISGVEFEGSGSAAYNYTFYVGHPAALGVDADYWNITVYADYTGSASTNGTYFIHVHINDGTTNLTKNVSLAVKNDHRVYANVSHAHSAFAAMDNGSAVYYVELLSSGGVVLASYSGHVTLSPYEGIAAAITLLMVMVPLVIIIALIDMLSGSFKRKQ
jgi:hypothetical protein